MKTFRVNLNETEQFVEMKEKCTDPLIMMNWVNQHPHCCRRVINKSIVIRGGSKTGLYRAQLARVLFNTSLGIKCDFSQQSMKNHDQSRVCENSPKEHSQQLYMPAVCQLQLCFSVSQE